MNYYNENDPKAAAWLRELITWGQIPDGVVDDRSIADVRPSDLAGFTQCHFFAGIGGWSLALRLAGWPDDRPIWTGSCPCQPFSQAGKNAGFDDERHLWPAFHWLIDQCRPDIIVGEQVASKDGLVWLDLVQADLEASGYASWAADLCAAGVGAPHLRQRLYWVGYSSSTRGGWYARSVLGAQGSAERSLRGEPDLSVTASCSGGLAEPQGEQSHGRGNVRRRRGKPADSGNTGVELANADDSGSQRRDLGRDGADQWFTWPRGVAVDWLPCRDGRARPVESGTQPLAHGLPGRVGLLRGYGNAIVPQVAQAFIEAVCEI